MSQFNKIIIEGNLVDDPKVFGEDTSKGTSFTIANNTGFGEHSSVNYFDCVAFGRRGEVIAEHFQKGKGIQVEGQMLQRRIETKEGARYRFDIRVSDFVFRGGKEKAAAGEKAY